MISITLCASPPESIEAFDLIGWGSTDFVEIWTCYCHIGPLSEIPQEIFRKNILVRKFKKVYQFLNYYFFSYEAVSKFNK
jgi:hypothetical protein